ncbi:MAG: GNAT family N-acetyltransferase [Pseudomonadota bacterium]
MRDFRRFAMVHVAKATGREPTKENPTVFANLDLELADLPGRYGPHSGCLLLAQLDGRPVGTAAYFGRFATEMEVKRMFVQEEARGHWLDTQLLEVFLTEARDTGYRRFKMSIQNSLCLAHGLYRRMGFADVPVSKGFPGAITGVDL